MSTQELVSVVITNYNRRDDLREALYSIQQQDYWNIEIIVVDNASRDGSLEMLATEFPSVHTIPLQENTGMDGYSIGFQRASGEYIFQMDNDSLIPDSTVLSEVVRRFQEGSENLAGIATRVEEYRADCDDIENLRQKDKRHGLINSGAFHSGGVAFRRSLLNKVGYYNRDVFLYVSELFLGMKILAAGYQIHFFPEILMLHKSSGVSRSSRGTYFEMRNRYWFMRRFGTFTQQLTYLPGMLLHDFFYSTHKRAQQAYIAAIRDGFGPLPVSLRPPLRCQHPDFIRVVEQTGKSFTIAPLLQRMHKRMFK